VKPDTSTRAALGDAAGPNGDGSAPVAAEAASPLGCTLVFEDVYRQHFDFACRSLCLLGVAPDALEDAAQDVFGIASRRLGEFAGKSSIKTWIFAIVQRVAANHRRSQRRKRSPLEPLPEATIDEAPNPEENAEAAQSAALIQAFAESLDEGRRALLVLGLIEGVPMRELAASQGVPLHTAYSRTRALRSSLEAFLRKHEVDHG
jgi:RNA polymerase sigma-70 factor (ECF subfamily)